MKQQHIEFNVEYFRRLAKKIKKEKNITHHQALDLIAKNNGFLNWKYLLKKAKDKTPINLQSHKKIKNKLTEELIFNPYRNLLVGSINKLIEKKCFSLNPTNTNAEQEKGHVLVSLFGHPSIINWSNRGHDELLISVWWKYDHDKNPQANLVGDAKENFYFPRPMANRKYYKNFVGVVANCWFERRTGKYIQGESQKYIETYTRKGELENLKKIPIQTPNGYKKSGPFHM